MTITDAELHALIFIGGISAGFSLSNIARLIGEALGRRAARRALQRQSAAGGKP